MKELVEINIKDIYNLLESTYDLLLVVDNYEIMLHASPMVARECKIGTGSLVGRKLGDLLSDSSLDHVREAMASSREGFRGNVIFTMKEDRNSSLPLKVNYAGIEEGELFLFYGNIVDRLGKFSEWEKEDVVKELACLYSVAEWIKVSSTIKDFFTDLPFYISRGMHYPEYTIVYSIYQDVEYGRKPPGKYLSSNIEVNNKVMGEIRIGYADEKYVLMPEEQKMLDEISRMLGMALERKVLSERLTSTQDEASELSRQVNKLQEETDRRTREFEEQCGKLDTVNSYLDRVSRDWEESQVRLETMFEAIPDRVALIDRNRNVIMTNRKDVPAGNKCHKTIFDNDKPCDDCRLARVIRTKTPVLLEIKHDDEFYEVHALPIFDEENDVKGIIEFYRDTTRTKMYEQQLVQADKLASIGQLVSGIGHEINNPNQFIKGNIKIIEQAITDMLPIIDKYYEEHPDLKIARLKYDFFRENILMLVHDMHNGSERIKNIVEGLKRFARRDEGHLIDDVDINTIIEESARLVEKEVHKTSEVELDLAHDLPTFTGNSQKIEQVIINLMINASQAIPDGRRGLVRVSTRYENGNVVIEVRDNGKGMTEKTRKLIFDPFFTTRRGRGGTGLGLSIAYGIIEEHKGTITVSSKIGDGSTFTIKIPAGKGKDSKEMNNDG